MSNFMSNDNALTIFTKYANAINSKCEQVSTIPTASQDYENKILQYVGETSGGFNNGYFYKCVNDNNVYKWNVVGIANDTNFSGTLEAFNQLPQEEQDKYQSRDLWNDFNGMPIDTDLNPTSTHPVENQAIAKNIEAVVNVYGSKNLLPNNAETQTINGVTFTVNSDGSITANGTATANINLDLLPYENLDMNICSGKIISGCNSGSLSTYYLYIQKAGSPYTVYARCTDQPVILPVASGNANCRFYVLSGAVLNNVTIYPMIRDPRISDPTYVPYAMTNREITQAIQAGPRYTQRLYNFQSNPVTFYQRGVMYYAKLGSAATLFGRTDIKYVLIADWNACNEVPLVLRLDGGDIYMYAASPITAGSIAYNGYY